MLPVPAMESTIILFAALFLICATSPSSRPPCQNNDAFYFNVQPKGITVREGGRAFLECNVSNHCNIQFHWTLNEQTLVNTTRRYQNGSNLVITRVNRTLDGAEFHCIATLTTTLLSKQSQPAVLSIQWISENASVYLASPSSEDELINGRASEMQLKCIVNGSDEPTVKWFLNGRKIKKSDRITLKQRKLIIKSPSTADNGVYSCEAENSAGVTRSKSNYVLSIVGGADVPKIKILPEDQIAKLDDSIIFDCQYDNANSVSWKKVENEDLDIGTSVNNRIRKLTNGSLLITNLKTNDYGSYECVGFGRGESRQAYAASLTIAYLDNFSPMNFEPTKNWYVVGQNKRFEVTCVPPKGFPEPTAYWVKSNEKLTSSGRVRSMEDLRLIIDGAKQEDRGDYECVAENMAGVKRGTVKVFVSRPPEIDYHPASLDVEEGATTFFECKYKGNEFPVTVVDWEKSGEPLPLNHRDQRIKIFPNNGTLIIDSVSIGDQGDYHCVVRTGDQKPVASKAAKLTVREKLKFLPKPVDKKLEKNSTAQIPCKAAGHKPPAVKWYRTGYMTPDGAVVKKTVPEAEFSPNIRDRNGILSFHPVRFEDSGTYMCVAVNGQGIINETIKVEVFVSPEFLQSPKNVTTEEGNDVWFHCVVRGEPTPTVQWYYESLAENLWRFNHTKFENNSILLRNVTLTHGGKFVCMAGNKGGFKRQEAVLCVRSQHGNSSSCGRHLPIVWSHSMTVNNIDNEIIPAVADAAETVSLSATTIGIAAGSAAGYILLVLLLVVYCGYRRRRIRERKIEQPTSAAVGAENNVAGSVSGNSNHHGAGDSEILLGTRISNGSVPYSNGVLAENGHVRRHHHHNHHPHSTTKAARSSPTSSATSANVDRLQYPRNNLEFQHKLGSGVFGDVHIMKIVRSKNANELERLVVVKMLTNKDENVYAELAQEIDVYTKCEHPNVVKLIGLCREKEPFLILSEYLEFGNLKHYLQSSRGYKNNGVNHAAYPPPLRPDQIVSIAYQISLGMEHLTNQRFVHKDLAARNVLLSPDLQAKVTHLSLNNDQFAVEYYTYHNVVKPLRWMPEEAFLDDDFSMKSDVWSFGVLVWELLTVGELPYQLYNNDQVIEKMKRRELQLTVPSHAPTTIAELLTQCWSTSPKERPTFVEIRETFERIQVECVI